VPSFEGYQRPRLVFVRPSFFERLPSLPEDDREHRQCSDRVGPPPSEPHVEADTQQERQGEVRADPGVVVEIPGPLSQDGSLKIREISPDVSVVDIYDRGAKRAAVRVENVGSLTEPLWVPVETGTITRCGSIGNHPLRAGRHKVMNPRHDIQAWEPDSPA
jgi:hypothetical protein